MSCTKKNQRVLLRYQKPKHDKSHQLKTELDRIRDDGRGKDRRAYGRVSKQKRAKISQDAREGKMWLG
jgi:hypothetical protein